VLTDFIKTRILRRRLKRFGANIGLEPLKSAHQFHFERGAALRNVKCIGKGFFLKLGGDTYWRSGVAIGNISIGRFCSIAINVTIGLEKNGHPTRWLSSSPAQYSNSILCKYRSEKEHAYQPQLHTTTICSDVWIGDQATIMNGLTIGTGAIVAAGSIVTKSVPAYAIVAGIPATIIKYRFDKEKIEKLLDSQWWSLAPNLLANFPFQSVDECLSLLEKIAASKTSKDSPSICPDYGEFLFKGVKSSG